MLSDHAPDVGCVAEIQRSIHLHSALSEVLIFAVAQTLDTALWYVLEGSVSLEQKVTAKIHTPANEVLGTAKVQHLYFTSNSSSITRNGQCHKKWLAVSIMEKRSEMPFNFMCLGGSDVGRNDLTQI
jgi:hypothetical protein